MSRVTKGYLIGVFGTAIWSATAVFIRVLTETYHMPPILLAFWRDMLASLGLLVALLIIRPSLLRIERRSIRFFIIYGFVLSIFNALWTVSVTLNGAAVATVMVYSSAAFTALIDWRFFGEALGKIKILAVVLSIAGTIYVSGAYDLANWNLAPLGILTGIVSGLIFAGYSLFGKSSARRGLNPWTTMFYTFSIATFFLLFYNLGIAVNSGAACTVCTIMPQMAGDGWAALIALALVPTIVGYGLYTVTMSYLPASVANLIATLEPSFTALQAYMFIGETYTAPQIIGSLLIILGVVILRISEGFGPSEKTPQAKEKLDDALI